MNISTNEFLPHSTPMLWAKNLTMIDGGGATCESRIGDDFLPFLDDAGELPATLLIEIMAQTIGVWVGFHDRENGRPAQSGMLLGCRDFRPAVRSIPFDSTLRVSVEIVVRDEFVGVFEAKAFLEGACVARATLSTCQISWENLEELLKR
ncbi:MAG: hypothetical protein LBG65_04830 [Puniceicoccales bacterium]|nr:hypothetical protein [Puniceicoccales bacterium]